MAYKVCRDLLVLVLVLWYRQGSNPVPLVPARRAQCARHPVGSRMTLSSPVLPLLRPACYCQWIMKGPGEPPALRHAPG